MDTEGTPHFATATGTPGTTQDGQTEVFRLVARADTLAAGPVFTMPPLTTDSLGRDVLLHPTTMRTLGDGQFAFYGIARDGGDLARSWVAAASADGFLRSAGPPYVEGWLRDVVSSGGHLYVAGRWPYVQGEAVRTALDARVDGDGLVPLVSMEGDPTLAPKHYPEALLPWGDGVLFAGRFETGAANDQLGAVIVGADGQTGAQVLAGTNGIDNFERVLVGDEVLYLVGAARLTDYSVEPYVYTECVYVAAAWDGVQWEACAPPRRGAMSGSGTRVLHAETAEDGVQVYTLDGWTRQVVRHTFHAPE